MADEHTTTHTLRHGGRERTFRLHRPPDGVGGERPLIVALHGGRGTGAGMERLSGLSQLSDREGFAVVYPDGVGGTWNDGRELDSFPAMREDVDDVGLIESLIDHLVDGFDVDASRVYATGISNGGHMSHRLGVDLSHRLAAIAPVAASMPSLVQERAKPSNPIGVIVFFGDEDPLNFWDGGGRAGGKSPSVPEIMRWWALHNGCNPEPSIEHLPGEIEDGTRIRREVWGGSPSEVVLYAIEGGGHTWPNGYPYAPERLIGRTTRNLDASQTMWVHFRRHQR
jgi:polyhydroxybutyrate depolymerase